MTSAVAQSGFMRQHQYMRSVRVGVFAAFAAVLTAMGAPPASAARGPETAVQRLHRKGVQCMDVIEREDCAIENFEAVLEERTTERELVSDSMLRLVKLYRHQADHDAVKDVMRQFWDVGMKRRSLGHLPYGARFFGEEFDILMVADMQAVAEAPLTHHFADYAEMFFTCDELHRGDVKEQIRWKRARRKAQLTGRKPYEIIYEEMDERERQYQEYKKRRDRTEPPGARDDDGDLQEPVFAVATCPLARALGDDDLRAWGRVAGAMNHDNFSRSMAALQIPDLDKKTKAAVESGALQAIGPDRWVLPEVDHQGHKVHIAKTDLDEVVMAPDHLIGAVLEARRQRKVQLHKDIVKLVKETPRDATFFAVVTKEAMAGMGFAGMRKSTAGFLQSLLPKPKGLQVATLIHDDLGFFTRMPTDNPVKAKMLINIAQLVIDGQTSDNRQVEQMLRHLDIAEANDKRALLLTYLLTPGDIQKMIDF
jgi:hypothetical protein